MGWFLLFYFFSEVSAQSLLNLNINDVCRNGPDIWKCKRATDCAILIDAIKNGTRPDICGFQGLESIICCPTSAQVTTSEQPTSKPSEVNWGSSSTNTKPPANTVKPTIEPNISKAEQKCKEYSQYAYKVSYINSPLPNEEPNEIRTYVCNAQTLIVGGKEAEPKEYPHMALIGYGKRPKINWGCGGSLISPKFVLSAAHCTKVPPKPFGRTAKWVRLGDLDTSTDTDDAQPVELQIIRRLNHPEYRAGELQYHDIALYELESEVKLGFYIRPICLHTSKNIKINTLIASGWGHRSYGGESSSKLLYVHLPLVSHEKCNNVYGTGKYEKVLPHGIDDNTMLCAGGKLGKDTCQGDSGGPIQIPRKDLQCMHSQVGVVSFGIECALNYPGVYTRVSYYVPWIENIVWP